ncbi:MAG: RNA chaperone Hfq [Acidobacteriia bacterium]|nr:RNA chaperone Hfq [Terriglobia bacterium]
MNRKLIRSSLADVKDRGSEREPRSSGQQQSQQGQQRRKPVPPEQTNAENFYYVKQMQNKTPMVMVLLDGEILHGVIEWYDKRCIKVNRINESNLLLMKHAIRYMYKENEDKAGDD